MARLADRLRARRGPNRNTDSAPEAPVVKKEKKEKKTSKKKA